MRFRESTVFWWTPSSRLTTTAGSSGSQPERAVLRDRRGPDAEWVETVGELAAAEVLGRKAAREQPAFPGRVCGHRLGVEGFGCSRPEAGASGPGPALEPEQYSAVGNLGTPGCFVGQRDLDVGLWSTSCGGARRVTVDLRVMAVEVARKSLGWTVVWSTVLRGPCQQDQDAQAPDVRPRRIRTPPQASPTGVTRLCQPCGQAGERRAGWRCGG
jgi:hypothetical protein